MSTGERIRKLRVERRMTQGELADLVGNDGNTISRWEHNKVGIGSGYIMKLAQVLNTTADYLLGKTDDPSSPQDVLVDIESSKERQPTGKRLIIKNRDMYVDLPESSESFEILRRLFDMQAAKNGAGVSPALVQA